MFRRVALTGSAELFRNTRQEILPPDRCEDPAEGTGLALDGSVHELSLGQPVETYYQYSLTEEQVHSLVDALQKLKYPHNLKTTTRLSMEDFEGLEALRQVLLDGLR